MSEGDFIVKFWSPIVEKLFMGSMMRPHWGDTIPDTFKPLVRSKTGKPLRMDLRMICMSTLTEVDISAGEFAKHITPAKYYHDKLKLVLSAKAQLNSIVKEYKLGLEQTKDIRICMVQVMGLEAELNMLQLVANGIYILQKGVHFKILSALEDMQTGMKSLVAGLSIMKSIHTEKHAHDGKCMATLIQAEGTTEPARGAEARAWTRDLYHFVSDETTSAT
ncbi:hypothetical protein DFQ28_000111 [Apophysomyces sp. BC1034]|nr:hypothetical protein DFQ29_009443 [Apophysomyces sp. BC1021]KAG0191455.1 hypothetical protein DFQ28_000111 [Apophysomyces sp. BC1034]